MKVSLIVTCLFSPALLFAAATHGEAQIPIAEVKRSEPVDFAKDVLPVLRKNCFACHNASEAYAELSLETAEAIRTGGDSGPAVVPGKSGESLLLAVAAHQKKPLMPPPDNDVAAAKLTSQELGLLKLWIDQGADGSGETVLSPSEWRPLPPGIHPIYAVALTRDGQYAACGRANQIYIYHAPSGQLVARLNDPSLQEMSTDKRPGIAHLDMVQSLAFSPEGNRLASGGFRVAKIWRQPTDVQRYQVSLPADVTALATEPDQQIFATGHADGQIFTWNLADGKQAGQFSGHTDRITDLRFAAGGQTLVSSSADQTIRTWDVAEGKLRGRIDSPVAVESLAVTAGKAEEEATPVPELLVTGGGDNYLRKWQLPDQLPETLVDAATNAKAFALSVDQKFLTIGGESGKVTVVDLAGEAEQNEWQAHQSAIHSIAVRQFKSGDQDQIQIATASEDGTVKLSAYPGGETLGVLRATSAPVASVAFHPSAPQLASLDADGNVRMWNLETPQLAQPEARGEGNVTALAISKDRKRLAVARTAGGKPAIVVYQADSGTVTSVLTGHTGPIRALSFSNDAGRLVSGSQDKTVRVWNLSDGKVVASFDGHTQPITAVCPHPDNQQVYSASADGKILLWKLNPEPEAEPVAFEGHTGAIVALEVDTGNQLISAAADKTIRFWNGDGKQARAITHPTVVTAIAISPDGQRIAAAGNDNKIVTYNAANGQAEKTLDAHQSAVASLSISADNARLLSTAADGQAIVWNLAEGQPLERFVEGEVGCYSDASDRIFLASAKGELRLQAIRVAFAPPRSEQPGTQVAYHPNGQMLVACHADGSVRAYSTTTGDAGFTITPGAPVHDLAISVDGQRLALACEDKQLRIYNAGNGAALAPNKLEGFSAAVTSVTFGAEGKRIIASSMTENGGELRRFNAENGEYLERAVVTPSTSLAALGEQGQSVLLLADDGGVYRTKFWGTGRLEGHSQPVTALADVPDEPLQVISGGGDGTLRHWNLESGQQIRQFNHGGKLTAVASSPDGERFASAREDANTIRLWDATNGQQIAEMKGDNRAANHLAKMQQQKSAADARLKQTTDSLEEAKKDLPEKNKAETEAADALAKANKDLETKTAELTKAESAKAEAEKLAIEAAAKAQAAEQEKAKAEALVTEKDAAVKLASEKLNRAKSAAAASAEDQKLADAVKSAEAELAKVQTELKSAQQAVANPTKAAADASKAAQDAANKAVETSKPYTEALAALDKSQSEQRLAEQNHEVSVRESKAAAELVAALETDLKAVEAKVTSAESALQQATEAAKAAELPVRTLAFSPAGDQLASGGDFASVHIWDTKTGAAVKSYVGHEGPVTAIDFASGDTIVSAGGKVVIAWELNPKWSLERTIGSIEDPGTLIDRVAAVDFDSEGKLLATGGGIPSRSGELQVFKVEDGSRVMSVPDAHEDAVFGIEFSPDGKRLASAGADKYVRVFDVATGEQQTQFEGHTEYALDVSWRGDGSVLASSGADARINVWDAETGDRLRDIDNLDKQVFSIKFMGQSNNVAICTGNPRVRFYRTDNGQNLRNFNGAGSDYLYCVDVTPDGKWLAAGGHDGVLRIWDGAQANSQPIQAIEPPPSEEETAEATAASE